MPFNNTLVAETLAFDHGCGLHCLARSYVLNLKNDNFPSPLEKQRSLEVLLKAFKEEYGIAAQQNLTTAELEDILVNDLENSVHCEVVLSRVLRNMAPTPADRKPGVPLDAEAVCNIANRLGIRVESYESIEGQVNAQYELDISRGIPADKNIIRQQISNNSNFDANRDTLRIPQNVAQNAPVLKLRNENGGHWEWEYNIHQKAEKTKEENEAKNREEVAEHNRQHSPVYRSHYCTNNSSGDSVGASVHAENVKQTVNNGLFNRRRIGEKAVQNALMNYERTAGVQARMDHAGASTQSSSKMPSAAGTNASSNPLSGLMGLFGSFFNGTNNPLSGLMNLEGSNNPLSGLMGLFRSLFGAYMPALTAPASAPVMETAIPVVKNIFQVLGDFFNPSDSKQDRTEFEQYLNLISNDTDNELRKRLEEQYGKMDDAAWAKVSQGLTPSDKLRKQLQEQYNRKDDTVWAQLSQHLLHRRLVSHDKAKEIAKRNQTEAGIGGIFGVIFGFVSKLFGFAEAGFALTKQMKNNDTTRPLSAEELKSAPEGALLDKYLKFLPKESEAFRKRINSDWRNPAISKEAILADLRTELVARGFNDEQQALLFDQYLAKLRNKSAKEQLQKHFAMSGGSPLVWRILSRRLINEGLNKEASDILSRNEVRVLHTTLRSPELKQSHDYYNGVLNRLAGIPVSKEQYQVRCEMLDLIARDSNGDGALHEGLGRLFETFEQAQRQAVSSSAASLVGQAFGSGHAPGVGLPAETKNLHENTVLAQSMAGFAASYAAQAQSGASVASASSSGLFTPAADAARAARPAVAFPVRTPDAASGATPERGRGAGGRSRAPRLVARLDDGREVMEVD